MSEWISVKDRLPEEEGEFLCCSNIITDEEHIWIEICYFYKSNEWIHYAGEDAFPTHWMPLPEPPK